MQNVFHQTKVPQTGHPVLTALAAKIRAYEPLVLLLTVGTCVALSAIVAKAAPVAGWSPLALLQWSMLGATGLVFAAVSQLKRRTHSGSPVPKVLFNRPALTYMAVTGFLLAMPYILSFNAAPHVGAGFVALCFGIPLVLTYVLSIFYGLDALDPRRIIGVAFGAAGAILLAVSGGNFETGALLWVFAALMIPVFLAIGNIYRSIMWPKGATSGELSIGLCFFAFVTLVIVTGVSGAPILPEVFDANSLGLLLAQTCIFSVFCGLYFRLQKVGGPVYLSQVGSIGAVAGLILAYLIFSEVPNTAKILAAVTIGLGIFFVSRRGHDTTD